MFFCYSSLIVELPIHSKMEKNKTPKQTSVLMMPYSIIYSPRVLLPFPLLLPAMPKSSLEQSRSLTVYKDILSELYLGGLPWSLRGSFPFSSQLNFVALFESAECGVRSPLVCSS